MKAVSPLFLALIVAGATYSQNDNGQNERRKWAAPDIKIIASIPNASALELVMPYYSPDLHVAGNIVVQVKIDKTGQVVSARAVSGHPLLRSFAIDAARKSKFERHSGKGIMHITGTITY